MAACDTSSRASSKNRVKTVSSPVTNDQDRMKPTWYCTALFHATIILLDDGAHFDACLALTREARFANRILFVVF
jgi:hypothetical protein